LFGLLAFWIFRKQSKKFPARNQRRKGCFH
jgi:hypothetical protein